MCLPKCHKYVLPITTKNERSLWRGIRTLHGVDEARAGKESQWGGNMILSRVCSLLAIDLSINLSMYLSMYLSIYLSIDVSVCVWGVGGVEDHVLAYWSPVITFPIYGVRLWPTTHTTYTTHTTHSTILLLSYLLLSLLLLLLSYQIGGVEVSTLIHSPQFESRDKRKQFGLFYKT